MEKIKLNISEIVSKNLKKTRKERLDEAFIPLNESKSKDEFLENFLIISSKLIDQGYTLEEIENPLNKLNLDWGGAIKQSIWSEIKEYAIKWILQSFGLNVKLAEQLSIALADMNPLDIIRIFKDPQSCQNHMPHIYDAISELILRNVGAKITNSDSNVGNKLIGNIFGEAIRQSNLGETVTNITCKIIHK